MARIIVQTSSGEQIFELQAGQTVTLGRDPTNRVPLPDATGVSRRHCRIGPREGGERGWEIADLGSTNGTRVGGQKMRSKALVSGDEIEVGSARIRFEDPEDEARLEALSKEGVCFLEWVSGQRKGERIPLDAKRITIGRREQNVLTLDDRMVSGHHAEIDRDLNGYTLRDLGSTNGTVVNGEPISEALLTHGARVRIGNARFVFKDPSMKDVEVALEHFEEDEGWGMMGEIDLARARGSRAGLLVVLLLFAAAGVGGWWLSRQESETPGGRAASAGLVENGEFDGEDVPWSGDREEGVSVSRKPNGGSPGAWLNVRNTGEADDGPTVVTYEQPIETAGARPLHVEAAVRKQGDDGAAFVVIWASDPTAEELAAGVTSLERTDVLGEAGGSWKRIDEVLVPPPWARTARFGVYLPTGAGAGVDAVSVTWEPVQGARPSLAVRKFKTAYVDDRANLELLANRTVLLTGVRPLVELADGTQLTNFHATGAEAAVSEGGVELKGAFEGPEGDIGAVVRWSANDEGLRVEIAAEGVAAVGLVALAPTGNLRGAVNVLGDFMPQTLPIGEATTLEKVTRTLVGDAPPAGVGLSTLLAFNPETETPVASLAFGRSRDDGLVSFTHRIPGAEGAVRLVTDFSGQKRQAEADLHAAKALAATRPGEAIRAFRDVALAYPFEKDVHDDALQSASSLETKARADVTVLDEAVRDFDVYRSADALAAAEKIASRLEAQFLGSNAQEGTLESEVAELVARVGQGRAAFEVERAVPDVDRLERLYTLLGDKEGYAPMAALYARAIIRRYEHLAAQAPDIARRLQAAKERLEQLSANEAVQHALPPVPETP